VQRKLEFDVTIHRSVFCCFPFVLKSM